MPQLTKAIALDETLQTTNTRLQTVATNIANEKGSVDAVKNALDTNNTQLQTIGTQVSNVNDAVDTSNTRLQTIGTNVTAVGTQVGNVKTALDNANTALANKLQMIVDKLGNVQSINGQTGEVTLTFTTLSASKISGTDSDYLLTVTPGTVSSYHDG